VIRNTVTAFHCLLDACCSTWWRIREICWSSVSDNQFNYAVNQFLSLPVRHRYNWHIQGDGCVLVRRERRSVRARIARTDHHITLQVDCRVSETDMATIWDDALWQLSSLTIHHADDVRACVELKVIITWQLLTRYGYAVYASMARVSSVVRL